MKWIKADVKPDLEKYKDNLFILRVDNINTYLCFLEDNKFIDDEFGEIELKDCTHYLILEEPKDD